VDHDDDYNFFVEKENNKFYSKKMGENNNLVPIWHWNLSQCKVDFLIRPSLEYLFINIVLME